MLFSVITLTRNNPAGLSRTGASLAAQEYEDFEWIVIDLSSKSGKLPALAPLQTIHVIDFIGKEGEALRHAVSIAKGRYILFLRPNEILAQTQTLQKIKNSLEYSRADLIYGDYWHLGKGRTKYKSAQSHLKKNNGLFTSLSSIFFSRKLVEYASYIDLYEDRADSHFILRATEFAQTILYLPIAISVGDFSSLDKVSRFRSSHNRKLQVMQLLNWGMFYAPPRLYRNFIPPIEEEIPLQL